MYTTKNDPTFVFQIVLFWQVPHLQVRHAHLVHLARLVLLPLQHLLDLQVSAFAPLYITCVGESLCINFVSCSLGDVTQVLPLRLE